MSAMSLVHWAERLVTWQKLHRQKEITGRGLIAPCNSDSLFRQEYRRFFSFLPAQHSHPLKPSGFSLRELVHLYSVNGTRSVLTGGAVEHEIRWFVVISEPRVWFVKVTQSWQCGLSDCDATADLYTLHDLQRQPDLPDEVKEVGESLVVFVAAVLAS